MEPSEALTIAFSIHVAGIPLSVAAARQYGDRSEWLQKSLTGVDGLLRRLRQALGESLRVQIATLPPAPANVSNLLVNAAGGPLALDGSPSPLQGEAFGNVVHDFVRVNVETIRSYSAVLAARNGWASWARVVSWGCLLLAIWEFSASGVLLLGKVRAWPWNASQILLTVVPTALFLVLILAGLAGTQVHHDRIMNVRRTNDPL